jgi:hypothetical protein
MGNLRYTGPGPHVPPDVLLLNDNNTISQNVILSSSWIDRIMNGGFQCLSCSTNIPFWSLFSFELG